MQYRIRTPSTLARRCSICSKVIRLIPENPCPDDFITCPRNCTKMSSQYANLAAISR